MRPLKIVSVLVLVIGLSASPSASVNLKARAVGDLTPASLGEKKRKSDIRKEDFSRVLENLRLINEANDKADLGNLIAETEANFEKVQSNLVEIRKELEDKNLPAKILERLDVFQINYERQIKKIIDGVKTGNDMNVAVSNLLKQPEFERKVYNPHPFRVVEFNGRINKLPVSLFKSREINKANSTKDLIKGAINSIRLEKNTKNNPNLSELPISPVSQSFSDSSLPDPSHTAETEEIQFTQSIKDLAQSLNYDPLAILSYVKNNIDYLPYYGSKKGADATLMEKVGNDFDQVSLLLALLRVGDGLGNFQTPARYRQANIKLELGEVMDSLGVEDPIVAASVLSKTGVPYVLYVDAADNPLFFVIEHTYAEAYIDYDYTRGIIQGDPDAGKRWVPMDPSLSRYYKSQILNVLEDMNFDTQMFYEDYLAGFYPNQKPIEALKQKIESYLEANHPELIYDDILLQSYNQEQNFEFIPPTLPYEIVDGLGEFAAAPENLKHKIEFSIQDKNQVQTFLSYTVNIASIANKELVAGYMAATPDDQAVIDSFPSIYDVIPLSLVNLKPVIKVSGQVLFGGAAGDPEVPMGATQSFKMIFKVPQKEITGSLVEQVIETIEKPIIAGNAEGIAINTDYIVPPELRPQEDTQTSEFVPTQKLYRTALNYLYRLQRSHDELAGVIGARFTNAATRAIVFNGIDVSYQSGEPYSFSWAGLRIDSSALVSYYHHFGNNITKQQKEFMYVFGLQASLDESSIFEDDFNIESISTVKGLQLINQGLVPGVAVKKITEANLHELGPLPISTPTKTLIRDLIRQGNTIYTPTQPFTYRNWTGLVYISVDPSTGFGGYIIGEGLNGGYTVEQWPDGWQNFWRTNLIFNLVATILAPTQNQEFTKGDTILWIARYQGDTVVPGLPTEWYDNIKLDTSNWKVGTNTLKTGYGTSKTVNIRIKSDCKLGNENCDYDNFIIYHAQRYGIPPGILKSLIHKETESNLFIPETYRYEPFRDYTDFSGPGTSSTITSHPFKQFALAGNNINGEEIIGGNQVDDLFPSYTTIIKSFVFGGWNLRSIILKDRNGDGKVTIGELYANDEEKKPGTQNWPPLPNSNFTPQLLLSASYGLGHVLYWEAIKLAENPNGNLWFDTSTNGTARSIYDVVKNPSVSIELTASILKKKFNLFGATPGDNCEGWGLAVERYNGSGSEAVKYREQVCKIYNSGIYNEL